MAGKLYSIVGVLSRLHKKVPPDVNDLRRSAYTFTIDKNGSPVAEITVRVCDARGLLVDNELSEIDLASVETETDFISEADAIVFVIDSRAERECANRNHLTRLRADLASRGVDLDSRPVIFQANRRDESRHLHMDVVREIFCSGFCDYAETVAIRAEGVVEALFAAVRLCGRIARN